VPRRKVKHVAWRRDKQWHDEMDLQDNQMLDGTKYDWKDRVMRAVVCLLRSTAQESDGIFFLR
jgi:hypothetical protein